MNYSIYSIARPLLALNFLCLAYTASVVISDGVRSDTAQAKRSKGLQIIANHILSKTCWQTRESEAFKIGDRVVLSGEGKIPTSCIYSPQTKQFLQVGYLNGELQVLNIYSVQEAKNQISLLKKENQK